MEVFCGPSIVGSRPTVWVRELSLFVIMSSHRLALQFLSRSDQQRGDARLGSCLSDARVGPDASSSIVRATPGELESQVLARASILVKIIPFEERRSTQALHVWRGRGSWLSSSARSSFTGWYYSFSDLDPRQGRTTRSGDARHGFYTIRGGEGFVHLPTFRQGQTT